MRELLYGFFGEDRGQRAFLAAYLGHQGGYETDVVFQALDYFGKRFGPMNNHVVDRRCGDASYEAFFTGHPKLNWLFIGRDVDSFDWEYVQQRAEALRARIPMQWHHRTLLMLPVQCIEHWLLYLQRHPAHKPLEQDPNERVKVVLYADKTQGRPTIVQSVLATLTPERIAWLAEVSPSFRAFHQQVGTYLAAFSAS